MSDAIKNEAIALQILALLNEAGPEAGTPLSPPDDMEVLTGVVLSVVTVGGITGTSTNGEYTIRLEKGDTTDVGVCGECGKTECICDEVCDKCGNAECTCSETKH